MALAYGFRSAIDFRWYFAAVAAVTVTESLSCAYAGGSTSSVDGRFVASAAAAIPLVAAVLVSIWLSFRTVFYPVLPLSGFALIRSCPARACRPGRSAWTGRRRRPRRGPRARRRAARRRPPARTGSWPGRRR